MSAALPQIIIRPRRSVIVWLLPVQAVCAFTIWAVINGGQWLRSWLLGAIMFVMALPLLLSLDASLIAMMMFEPLRGFLRRAQYLIVPYSQTDPIHILTPVVTIAALAVLLRNQRLHIFRATTLAPLVSLLAAIFFLEIFNPLQGGIVVGLSGALLLLVPVAWFFFGQFVDERFITVALRLIVLLALVTSLYGIYQLTFGYPRFEQYWLDNVEFYNALAVGHVKRAVATFTSAEEWGRYTVLGALISFGFAVGAYRLLQRVGWFLCGTSLSILLLLTGQLTAIFGLVLGFMVLVLSGARSLRGVAARLLVLLLPLLLVAVLVKPPSEEEMWSKEETETVETLLSHAQRGALQPTEEQSLYVRLKIWQDLITNVIPYRPLGTGLGAGSLSALKFASGPQLPNSDNFVLVLAVACGIPGALLFLWILLRANLLAFRATRRAPPGTRAATLSRIVAALFSVFFLNSIFGLTFSLYAVAPIAWLLIGWTSAKASAKESRARETNSLAAEIE